MLDETFVSIGDSQFSFFLYFSLFSLQLGNTNGGYYEGNAVKPYFQTMQSKEKNYCDSITRIDIGYKIELLQYFQQWMVYNDHEMTFNLA